MKGLSASVLFTPVMQVPKFKPRSQNLGKRGPALLPRRLAALSELAVLLGSLSSQRPVLQTGAFPVCGGFGWTYVSELGRRS